MSAVKMKSEANLLPPKLSIGIFSERVKALFVAVC